MIRQLTKELCAVCGRDIKLGQAIVECETCCEILHGTCLKKKAILYQYAMRYIARIVLEKSPINIIHLQLHPSLIMTNFMMMNHQPILNLYIKFQKF